MTFAALPGYRLAYDRDGSAVYRYLGDGSPSHPPQNEWGQMNDESNVTSNNFSLNHQNGIVAVVFAVPTDLVGLYCAMNAPSTSVAYNTVLEVSSDTTNGQDGTWLEASAPDARLMDVPVTYRTQIIAVNHLNMKSVRVRGATTSTQSSVVRAFHIYASAQESFLQLWHPTLDQPLAYGELDWGVHYAGEANTKQFRVKNLRGMTAQDVSLDALANTLTESAAFHSFSTDGVNFSRPLNIGNLLAGAISGVITVRYAPPETATVSTHATQISAIPGGWV